MAVISRECRNRGMTLVELLTVIALLSVIVISLIGMTDSALKDIRIRAAIEQAQQDLQLLELIRRNADTGILNIERETLAVLREQLPGDLGDDVRRLLDALQPELFWPDYQMSEALYSIDDRSTSVIIRFPAADSAGLVIPHADASLVSGPGDDFVEYELHFRERSLNSFLYVQDYQRVKTFYGW